MLRKTVKDQFIKNNAIFFVGTLVVSVLTYLYHPVLSRMMDIESFGEVQALISIYAILGVILGVYRIIVVNIVSNTEHIGEKQGLILKLKKTGLLVVIIIAVLITVSSNYLKGFFNFDSAWPFVSLAVLLVIGLLSNFRGAILQGWHDFKSVSVAGIISASGRLAFAALLVYIGWSAFGAITALVIAELLTLLYLFVKTNKHLNAPAEKAEKSGFSLKNEMKYGLLVLAVTLCVTFLYSADVVIIKHFFPPSEAGLYSGIATIARIIFFITGSVAGVLLPSIKIDDVKNENKKILLKAVLILFALGGLSLLAFTLFPHLVIRILIGEQYLAYEYLLPRLSFLLFLISIINLIFFYYLALRKFFLSVISILSPLAIIVLSYFRHATLTEVIQNFLIVSIAILLYMVVRLVPGYVTKPKISIT